VVVVSVVLHTHTLTNAIVHFGWAAIR